MFIKILFISLFIFFVSCKPFGTTSSGGPGGPGAPIKPANCAAVTDLNKCATAQPQDNTDCAVNHTGLLCVVLPKTCAEILIKEDCPHLKPVCEWQTGNCVDKPGVPPPPGDPVKKDELIESITNNPAFDEADLDKFVSLDQTQLNEVLAEITKKDPAYKKDVMTKILTENKLNNFIKGDNLDDAFIAAFRTPDENDYAFSNALLDVALKDGSGISLTVKKDVVKKVFAFTQRVEEQPLTKAKVARQGINLGAYPLVTFSQLNLLTMRVKDDKKNELEQKLKKIFELGDEAIDAFYGYMIPQSWPGDDNIKITDKMDYRISSAIISLIIDKKMVDKIVTNKEQALKMIQVINRVKNKMQNFNHDLAKDIQLQIKDLATQQHFIEETNKYP